jgi:hypothetical protein
VHLAPRLLHSLPNTLLSAPVPHVPVPVFLRCDLELTVADGSLDQQAPRGAGTRRASADRLMTDAFSCCVGGPRPMMTHST